MQTLEIFTYILMKKQITPAAVVVHKTDTTPTNRESRHAKSGSV
ncbi:hypothetical protein [Vibrio alfacsensis]